MQKINKLFLFFSFCPFFWGCSKNDTAKLSVLSGYAAWQQNKWNTSIAEFLAAEKLGDELSDDEIKSYANYGISAAYLMQNEDTAASARLKKMNRIQDKKLQSAVFYQSGIISFKAKRYHEAAELFKKSLELVPGSIDAKINYELSKKYTAKINTSNECKTVNPFDTYNDEVFEKVITDLIKKKEQTTWHDAEQEQKPLPFDY